MGGARRDSYPASMRALHWAMALCIVGLIILGWYMTPFDSRPADASDRLYYWHKSFGILVLAMLLIRLVVRFRHRAELPAMPPGMASAERVLAGVSKQLLYLLMFMVPIAGWLHSSIYPYSSGVHFFIVDLPDLAPDNEHLSTITVVVHRWLGWSLAGLVALHVAGALKHRFFDRQNDVLPRMLQ